MKTLKMKEIKHCWTQFLLHVLPTPSFLNNAFSKMVLYSWGKKKVHCIPIRIAFLLFFTLSLIILFFSAIDSLPVLGDWCLRNNKKHGAPSPTQTTQVFFFFFLLSFWVWLLQYILTTKIYLNESPQLWSSLLWTVKLVADLDADPSSPGPSWHGPPPYVSPAFAH